MTIKITRQPAFSGYFGKVKLNIDGYSKVKIKSGETKVIECDRREVILQVKEFGSWSNKLSVNEGDHVEITKKSWDFWYVFFISAFSGIYLMFSPVAIWITFIWILFITAMPFFLFPTYELTKIE
ncbi:MAG: hypothetical protein JJU16_01740 [Alkalibacterium sp.]|nr:hypothetical protein [Alkalibacterium sp.]